MPEGVPVHTVFGDFTLFAANPSLQGVEWSLALQKACRVRDRLERAKELYKSVFSEFEQGVLDSMQFKT